LSRAYSTVVRRVLFLAFLAVLVCAAPALASAVVDYYETWSVNATLAGGGTVSGEFTIDTADIPNYLSNAVSSEDVTVGGTAVTAAGGGTFTFSSVTPTNVGSAFVGGAPDVFMAGGNEGLGGSNTYPTGSTVYELVLDFTGAAADLAGTEPLILTSSSNLEVITDWGEADQDPTTIIGISGGTLDPVPLPPSALLLGTGLIPLAWARRKKLLRK